MSQGKSGAAKIKKYQTIDRDFVGMPKSDGRVPIVGEVIDLFETQFGWRGRTYLDKKGRYYVSAITDYLVLCKVTDECIVDVSDYESMRKDSFRVSDFKVGLLVYRVISINGKLLESNMV